MDSRDCSPWMNEFFNSGCILCSGVNLSPHSATTTTYPYYPEYAWRFRWCIHIALTSVNRNWHTLIPLPFYFQIIHSNAKVNNAFPFHLMCGFKSPSAKSNGQTKGSLRFIAFQCIVEMQKTKDNFTPGWRWLPWNYHRKFAKKRSPDVSAIKEIMAPEQGN